ncbi:hypothetical protein FLONG3_4784 [Fusarium longipes]|uniref:Uncharacterized protein n=1 Tax=Fusarium longipes TaxID=694270 RepID=A0A395SYS2_9HYPO|nr:hypothetical protein FLONG3_4784 [Fusarium longipes]
MSTPLTFVNINNAPKLGPKQRRQMRAHVTQTNFAKRRQRLAKARDDNKSDARKKQSRFASQQAQLSETSKNEVVILDPGCDRLLINGVDSTSSPITYLLYTFRPLIFPGGTGGPGSAREAEWISLLQSEPALVEASISIALRHCPGQKDGATFRQAVLHKGRAIALINEKLSEPSGLTDGVLSAVFTLTYAELLGNDDNARIVHVKGLAQMIRVRRSTGNTAIPAWFCDFLLYDSLGHAMLTASYSNLPLIHALRNEDDPNQTDIATIRDRINELCLMINRYHNSTAPQLDIARVIGLEVERLKLEIGTLLGCHENYVRSLHDALQLYLLLLWPVEEPGRLQTLAEELKYDLLQPHMRLCASMEVLVWQLFVGVVAAGSTSEVRCWYTTRLRDVLGSMNKMGQEIVINTLTTVFTPDMCLLEKFQDVWQEILDY